MNVRKSNYFDFIAIKISFFVTGLHILNEHKKISLGKLWILSGPELSMRRCYHLQAPQPHLMKNPILIQKWRATQNLSTCVHKHLCADFMLHPYMIFIHYFLFTIVCLRAEIKLFIFRDFQNSSHCKPHNQRFINSLLRLFIECKCQLHHHYLHIF